MAGNDPLSENPTPLDHENEWSLIGMPGGAKNRLMVQVDPGLLTTVKPVMLPPSAETTNSTEPPPEWVPVYTAPGMWFALAEDTPSIKATAKEDVTRRSKPA